MNRLSKRLKASCVPKPGTKAWVDVLFLVIFGTWFIGSVWEWVFGHPDPNAYACGGPGFADFGCTGGIDAVIAKSIGIVFFLFLLSIVVISAARIIHRIRGYYRG